MFSDSYSRRPVVFASFGALIAWVVRPVSVETSLSKVVVHKDPNCGCCQKWADHLTAAGFPVEVIASPDLATIKAKLGVTDDIKSCHTAEVGGYVIEGHVPADAILRLLREKPAALGLAVPEMPAGSPGMEGSTAESYDVLLFGSEGRRIFARYKGSVKISL